MKTCSIIRLSEGFDIAVVICPADATSEDECTTFYEIVFGILAEKERRGVFIPIPREKAASFVSGQMDGIGWEICPDDHFPDLDAAKAWIERKRTECLEAYRATHPTPSREKMLALLERLAQGNPERLARVAEARRRNAERGGDE